MSVESWRDRHDWLARQREARQAARGLVLLLLGVSSLLLLLQALLGSPRP